MSETQGSAAPRQNLTRTLGLWSIVGLGLGYMTPTVVFDTFGIVANKSGSVVPLAYLMAMVVMLLTAVSYGRMAMVFPSAGSAYSYVSSTIGPRFGFLIGWSALLDYILLPLVNAVIIRSYMTALFPDVPSWIWVVVFVAAISFMCMYSMSNTSKLNMILVSIVLVLIVVDLVLTANALMDGAGTGTIFSLQPLWHENVELRKVMTGATIVAFSFIGFDAITMYTEEAKEPSMVPKAIMLALSIGGAIFFVAAFLTQSMIPDVSSFNEESLRNSALPQIAFLVGGKIMMTIMSVGAFAATVASSLASQASVSRLLFVMGRNGKGVISRFFGSLHPRYETPSNAVIFVGLVALLSLALDLDLVASLINFGALVAFTMVNLSVILLFAHKRGEVKTGGQIFWNIVMPVLGVLATVMLWLSLSETSTQYGLIWFGLGVCVLLWVTRFFKRPFAMEMGDGH
jgi:putrescine importer